MNYSRRKSRPSNPLIRYAISLQSSRLLEPEQATIQAAADRSLEAVLIESLPDESNERLAAIVQKTYAVQNCLELREKPSHWRLATEFFKNATPKAAAVSAVPLTFILLTHRLGPAYLGDVYDNLTFLPYFMAAGADYGTTIRAAKTADGLELNPLFQKIDHSRRTQIADWLLAIGGAFVLPSAVLLTIAALRGWAAYNNYQIPQQMIRHTARRLARERSQLATTSEDVLGPQASPKPTI